MPARWPEQGDADTAAVSVGVGDRLWMVTGGSGPESPFPGLEGVSSAFIGVRDGSCRKSLEDISAFFRNFGASGARTPPLDGIDPAAESAWQVVSKKRTAKTAGTRSVGVMVVKFETLIFPHGTLTWGAWDALDLGGWWKRRTANGR